MFMDFVHLMYIIREPALPLRVLALFPANVSSKRSAMSPSWRAMSSEIAWWNRWSTSLPDNVCFRMRRASSEFSGPASSAIFCHVVNAWCHLGFSNWSGLSSRVGHGILRVLGFHLMERLIPGGTGFLPTHFMCGWYFVEITVGVVATTLKDFVTIRWYAGLSSSGSGSMSSSLCFHLGSTVTGKGRNSLSDSAIVVSPRICWIVPGCSQGFTRMSGTGRPGVPLRTPFQYADNRNGS